LYENAVARLASALTFRMAEKCLQNAETNVSILDKRTLLDVSSSMVYLSNICLATAVCAARFSLLRSCCRSPEPCASSTISPPNCVKILTNSLNADDASRRASE